ncbi:single-stranded DNA-binding protein [bacterium]|nr:single-stranded DNA-binding protein [bacterium]
MSIAKATVTGTVYREPREFSTANDITIYEIILCMNDRDNNILIRVISKRLALESVVKSLKKNDLILVDGRLQVNTVKTENGTEKKVFEIDANAIEKIGGSSANSSSNSDFANEESIVSFGETEANELVNEEEIPF